MALTRIILWLGNSLVICALLMAATAISSLMLLDVSSALVMAALTLMVGVLGVVFIFTTYNTPARETNSDALLFLLLFWIIIPVVAALPFLFLNASPDWISAYFESVSAFTTTGASALNPDDLPKALLLWRSLIQWFGGVCVATFAVVILASLNLSGTGIHRSMLFTLKTGELFSRLVGIGRVIAGIYVFLAAVCFIGLVVTGTDVFSAVCLSLSGVSTGGLTPRSGPLAGYIGPISAAILAVFCLLGAMNVAVIWDLLRLRKWRNFKSLLRNVEHRCLYATIAILALVGIFTVGLDQVYPLFVESIFFVSTAGFDYNVIGIEMVPAVTLIAIALIGGSALATAGGVKMIRVFLLLKHLGTDLGRLSHPSRIIPVTFKARVIPDRAFLSIWMYFFGYTLFFGLGVLAMGATGLVFEDAVATSAASLSNMGPLLPATLPESGLTYADFTSVQKLLSAMFMLVGRVEVLAVLVLFTPSFWQQ